MKRTLRKASAAFLGAVLSMGLSAQSNEHHIYDLVFNRAVEYMTTNQYLLSGNLYPPMVNGWINSSTQTTMGRIQFQLLNSSLNTVTLKTYVAQDEKMLVESGACAHLSTNFTAQYGKQIAGGQFIYCGQVTRNGETGSNCGGTTYTDVFLMRLNSTGTPIWYKRYGVPGILYSVVQTSDGGFMACGTDHTGASRTPFILKTDGNGNVQWTKRVSAQSYWDPAIYLGGSYYQVINYGTNRCALVGSGDFNLSSHNVLVSIVDNAGNFIKNANYNSAGQQHGDNSLWGASICATSDGKLAVCGFAGDVCGVAVKLMIMKIDPVTMNLDFLKFYHPSGDPNYPSVGYNIKCINNKLCVAGVDGSPYAGVYAETDLGGVLSRYAVFGPVDYRVGKYITLNTTLGVPVISGARANGETFVIRNDYNDDCQAEDVQRDEYTLTYDKLIPQVENLAVSMVVDQVFVYDMSYTEMTVCEAPPAPFREENNLYTPERSTGSEEHASGTTFVPELLATTPGIVRVYPNPSSGSIVISHPDGVPVYYEIYCITGKKLGQGIAAGNEPVDISALEQGVYIVKLKDSSGTTSAIRLFKE